MTVGECEGGQQTAWVCVPARTAVVSAVLHSSSLVLLLVSLTASSRLLFCSVRSSVMPSSLLLIGLEEQQRHESNLLLNTPQLGSAELQGGCC